MNPDENIPDRALIQSILDEELWNDGYEAGYADGLSDASEGKDVD